MAVEERESGLLVATGDLQVANWAPTPTGLDAEEVRALGDADAKTLGLWHAEVAGDVPARPFWPAAVRRLSLEQRMMLASDSLASAAWKELECRRVRDGLWSEGEQVMTGVEYFILCYGHVQAEVGPPMPFVLWPEQREVLQTMIRELRLIILKARQLGLTWLALHRAFHRLAFDPETPLAKVLALSKDGIHASKLLQRARRINELMPPYLKVEERPQTRTSQSKFGIVDRGEMISLTSSPADARSETASEVIWDEAAFTRNGAGGEIWTALLPTLGERGRITVISTGNGPAEAPGDGQAFARLWGQATSGDPEVGLTPIFLPDSVHPGRSERWRRVERKKYLTEEDFLKEHPETEEHAFSVVGGLRVYLPAGINAAERLGGELDEMREAGELPEPEFIVIGGDYGEFTHLLPIWPLEAGGLYVPPGEVAPERPQEVGESARQIVESCRSLQAERSAEGNGRMILVPPIRVIRYDAAGIQSNRTFVKTVQGDEELMRSWDVVRKMGEDRVRAAKIAFGKYKDDTKDYLRALFTRSWRTIATRERDLDEDHDDYCDGTRIIAISPQNKALLRQLRGLEMMDDGTGRIRKGDDHGPDALIAGAAPVAVKYHNR